MLSKETPEDHGFNAVTWTGPLLMEYIKSKFGITYKKAQIYNIIKSLGFTYQKGKGTYPESDPVAQESFSEAVKKRIENPEQTVVLFEDEFSLSNTATVSYRWSVKGKPPKIQCKQRRRERQTVFGTVNPDSGQIVISFSDKGNNFTFIRHLKKVIRAYKGKKIILVLDNVRYHHALRLKPFLTERKDHLELMFLPPYSSNLNLIERVWWFMRKRITHNRYIETLKERKAKFCMMFSHYLYPNNELKIFAYLINIIYKCNTAG